MARPSEENLGGGVRGVTLVRKRGRFLKFIKVPSLFVRGANGNGGWRNYCVVSSSRAECKYTNIRWSFTRLKCGFFLQAATSSQPLHSHGTLLPLRRIFKKHPFNHGGVLRCQCSARSFAACLPRKRSAGSYVVACCDSCHCRCSYSISKVPPPPPASTCRRWVPLQVPSLY